MSCMRSHQIELLNLSNDEFVYHTILLVKGYVKQQHCYTTPNTIEKQQQQQVQLKLSDAKGDIRYDLTRPPSHRGEFKFLLDLDNHEGKETLSQYLQLSISYCSGVAAVRIRYMPQPMSDYRIQPLYIRCSNEIESTSNINKNVACELIDLNVRLVQCVYAEKLREAGFGRRTFTLNGRCQIFTAEQLTQQEAWQSSEDTLWERCGYELLNSKQWRTECTRLKFIAFIACTRYDGDSVMHSGDLSYANIRQHLYAHAALGGGGLALFGSAYFYAWAHRLNDVVNCFSSEVPVNLATQPDDSNYRHTLGGVYATTLGAVAHEVGHIFDLAHTDKGVMGNGFDLINRVFTVPLVTEDLPARVIRTDTLTVLSDAANVSLRPRITQVRSSTNRFLNVYHEQRQQNDAFYFTRNCAIILSHHKWLQLPEQEEQNHIAVNITFDPDQLLISITGATPLKLIEVRECSNSLVTNFFEFPSSQMLEHTPTFNFKLPEVFRSSLETGTHHLFVLAANGHIERFNLTQKNLQ